MAFPQNPTNGQTAVINYISYVYDSSLGVWTNSGQSAAASPVSSVAGRTGSVTLTAADISGGTFPTDTKIAGIFTANSGTASTSTGSGALVVNGGLGVSGTIYAGALSVSSINSTPIGTSATSTGAFSSLGVGTAASVTTGEGRFTNQIVAYYSDERLKKKIGTIENALDKIDELTGFLYVENDLARSLGFNNPNVQTALSAQAVKRVQPEVVKPAPFDIAQREDGSEYSKSGEDYLTVDYEKLIPLLVEGIKELRKEINQLKGE
jgi:hypothetical protein